MWCAGGVGAGGGGADGRDCRAEAWCVAAAALEAVAVWCAGGVGAGGVGGAGTAADLDMAVAAAGGWRLDSVLEIKAEWEALLRGGRQPPTSSVVGGRLTAIGSDRDLKVRGERGTSPAAAAAAAAEPVGSIWGVSVTADDGHVGAAALAGSMGGVWGAGVVGDPGCAA